jgi:hypothetical protein
MHRHVRHLQHHGDQGPVYLSGHRLGAPHLLAKPGVVEGAHHHLREDAPAAKGVRHESLGKAMAAGGNRRGAQEGLQPSGRVQ